jgi:hypothetical protein
MVIAVVVFVIIAMFSSVALAKSAPMGNAYGHDKHPGATTTDEGVATDPGMWE